MKKEIIINATSGETRIAILEDKEMVELYVESPESERMVGDIYLGVVENVIQGIQAAFVDIGLEQNGFLPFADVGKEYSALADRVDEEKKYRSRGRKNQHDSRKKPPLNSGQTVLVQVTKEPIGTKGTRLTTAVSLPGRFLVLVPSDNAIGVSRKIVDMKERRRLRMLARSIKPEGFGLIIRTVAVGKDAQALQSDLETLVRTWQRIEEKAKSSQTPRLLHKDMGLASSVIRDLFSPDIDRLLVDSRNQYSKISKYLKDVAHSLVSKLDLYKGKKPIFDAMGIEEEIDKSLSRKIWIKGGGHIIFDQTEALMVVDVNSGRAVREKDHEKNALQTDLEAARTIARQLRLRDSGGIIVIDFIDLEKETNRRKVIDVLKKEMSKDRASFDVLPMNDFGLVSLTRERVRPSLLYRYSEPCPRCSGMGRVPARSTLITKIERSIQRIKSTTGQRRFILYLHPEMAAYMTSGLKSLARLLMIKFFVTLRVEAKSEMREEEFELASFKGEKFDSYSFSS